MFLSNVIVERKEVKTNLIDRDLQNWPNDKAVQGLELRHLQRTNWFCV